MSYELQERLLKGSLWERARYMLGFFARRNTLSGSKKNIAAHYDLANSFYQLWLDAEMQYTCAYFNRPTDTLEDAQTQKMDLVCRKLHLQRANWWSKRAAAGRACLHMARNYGVQVKSFNISQEQIAFAQERAQRLGIGSDRVEYVHDDYRNIPSHVKSCDKFASICMLEHVGARAMRASTTSSPRCCAAGARDAAVHQPRNPSPISNPWLEKYVFPGYYNPSLGEILRPIERDIGSFTSLTSRTCAITTR